MRKLGTLALLTVLVVGAASNCWAVTVPGFPGTGDMFNSHKAVHVSSDNRDQSTGYLATADDTYKRATPTSAWVGTGAGVLSSYTDPSQGFMARTGAGGGTESTWGLLAFSLLEGGKITAPPPGRDH